MRAESIISCQKHSRPIGKTMMKFIITLISLFVTTSSFAINCDKAETQIDMNECAKANSDKVDVELNRIYTQILDLVKEDPVEAKYVRNAERAWIKYRDAQLQMFYPPREEGYYGTVQPLCDQDAYQRLTEARIEELKKWLKKPEEGDSCERKLYKNESW
jgi:uncharacterized protein YecT (DUF1311 family)